MEKINKKIKMHFEGLVRELKKVGGECVIVWHDYETETGGNAVAVLNPDTATALLLELFSRHPYLVPKALSALAMVTDDYDFENDDEDTDDDGPDDDPDDDDGVPTDGCAMEYDVCLN